MKNILANTKVPIIVMLIPCINALADVTTKYFEAQTLNPGSIRALILLLLIIHLIVSKRILNKIPSIFVYMLIYYFILILFNSSNFTNSFFSTYIKFFISVLMFPIGIYYIKTFNDLKYLNISVIIAALIICVNYIVAQIYGLGASTYIEDSFYTGGGSVGISVPLAVIILLAPLIYPLINKKKYIILTMIILSTSLIFVVLSLKRSSLLVIAIGYLIFGYLSYEKKKIFKYIIFGIIALFLLNIAAGDLLSERVAARITEKNSFENEARYRESVVVLNELVSKSVWHFLFGTELFNSTNYFSSGRQLHVDYNIILHGSGIIGAMLYFLLYLSIVKLHWRYKSVQILSPYMKNVGAVFWALIVASLAISASGGLHNIGMRSLIFLYLAAIIGIERNYYFMHIKNKRNTRKESKAIINIAADRNPKEFVT